MPAEVTYDVRVWKTEVYQGKTARSYVVQWKVGARRWKSRFKTAALGESFRSELAALGLGLAADGEAASAAAA